MYFLVILIIFYFFNARQGKSVLCYNNDFCECGIYNASLNLKIRRYPWQIYIEKDIKSNSTSANKL